MCMDSFCMRIQCIFATELDITDITLLTLPPFHVLIVLPSSCKVSVTISTLKNLSRVVLHVFTKLNI